MKRTLVTIRHAKAEDGDRSMSDFDRALTDQGKNDALKMGEALKELNIIPDLIIASSAKRTRQTAKNMALAFNYPHENIMWDEKLYQSSATLIESKVCGLNDSVKSVFLIAHNPGIHDFAISLDHSQIIDRMPTCGVVVTEVELEKWIQFPIAKKKIVLFKHPGKRHDTK